MKMTVTRHWPESTAFDGSLIPARSDSTTGESGWESVKEMQRELIRRFLHEKRFRIPSGISTMPLKFGVVYTVTLEEGTNA